MVIGGIIKRYTLRTMNESTSISNAHVIPPLNLGIYAQFGPLLEYTDGSNRSKFPFLPHELMPNFTFDLSKYQLTPEDLGNFNWTINANNGSIFRTIIHYSDLYLVPLIALVGLIGNLLSFTVFVCTYMRRLSSSIYLAALSVADSAFLICVLVSWGINTGVDLYSQDGWCQTFIYITYVSSFLSVWYVVSFTVERYIAVHYPLRRQDLCTTRRAKIVVGSLAAFAAVVYSFGTWTSGVTVLWSQPVCGPLQRYMSLVNILNYVDTVITLIIPFFSILIMNVRIVWKVVQFYRNRKDLAITEDKDPESNSSLGRTSKRIRRIQASSKTRALYTRTQVRVTKMLLAISTIFLVLNLPRHTTRTYSFFKTLTDEKFSPTNSYLLWQKAFQFLYYTHFSVNLFLYSAFGKNFRKALVWLGRRIRHNILEYFAKCWLHCRLGKQYVTARRDIVLYDYKITTERQFV